MDGLAGNTAVRSDFAGTTFVGTRFQTPRCRTRCNIVHDFVVRAEAVVVVVVVVVVDEVSL